MVHLLHFTDLITTTSKAHETNQSKESNGEEKDNTNVDSSVPIATTIFLGQSETTLRSTEFVREENKKSSFQLSRPVALTALPEKEETETRDDLKNDASGIGNVRDVSEEAITHDETDDVNYLDFSGATDLQHGFESTMLKKIDRIVASAAITCSISNNDDQTLSSLNTNDSDSTKVIYSDGSNNSRARTTFLFGGFELITSVKTVEVYAVRVDESTKTAPEDRKETYITTCKGIPARNLPLLANFDKSLRATNEEEPGKSLNDSDEKLWYKFIFVSPGGPKPVELVRLRYLGDTSSQNIIVRLLKIKCRLPDAAPASSASSIPLQQMPTASNISQGLSGHTHDSKGNGLASMMAMMGQMNMGGMSGSLAMAGPNMGGLPTLLPTNQQYQQRQPSLPQQPPYSSQQQRHFQSHQQQPQHQNCQHQQQDQHQQEKYHAEIMSSIAGLGMFLKSSEERNLNAIQTSLLAMEDRIMQKLDGLSQRLGVIEQKVLNERNEVVNDDKVGDSPHVSSSDGSKENEDIVSNLASLNQVEVTFKEEDCESESSQMSEDRNAQQED